MCGIFGIITPNGANVSSDTLRKTSDTLFVLSQSRGKESSGIAVASSDSISICKTQQPASAFIQLPVYRELISSVTPPFAAIGHARLVTNGPAERNMNNQPVVKDGIVGIHNGIITNDVALWKKFPSLTQRYEVDTEVLLSMTRHFMSQNVSIPQAIVKVFSKIEGSASIAFLFSDQNVLLLATNTGSLYHTVDKRDSKQGTFLFASERYILEQLGTNYEIVHMPPQTGCIVEIETALVAPFRFSNPPKKTYFKKNRVITDVSPRDTYRINTRINHGKQSRSRFEKLYEANTRSIRHLRRCTRCILPETMPFIEFDTNGVCNYCRKYQKQTLLGVSALTHMVNKYKRKDGRPDCIVAFSGGRDSSFALHYVKKVLGMNPVAYSYDWGMLTDLGRRNQARMCGALGVEHILVSANIKKKREYIQANVLAWLKKPDLGMIPLFMAGDKQYFYYANTLRKQMGIDLVIYSENALEQTDFKYGFCGVTPKSDHSHLYNIGIVKKLKLASYYASQYIRNPAYINSSIIDSISAFGSSYFIPHDYIHLFRYIPWEEKKINNMLKKEYNWELSPDTKTTWRIGDGTAAFYNYIYYMVAGFTENDTFRSNQIREGMITRYTALRLTYQDNQPRYESILWYCDTIGLDFRAVMENLHNTQSLWK